MTFLETWTQSESIFDAATYLDFEFALSETGAFMYMGAHTVNRVRKSIDRGKTWSTGVALSNNIDGSLISCSNSGQYVVAGKARSYGDNYPYIAFSSDFGESFSYISLGTNTSCLNSLIMSSDGTSFVGLRNYNGHSSERQKIFLGTNYGATLIDLSNTALGSPTSIKSLAANSDLTILYAWCYYSATNQDRLMKSEDSGSTWTACRTLTNDITADYKVTCNGTGQYVIVQDALDTVYMSYNSGDTWQIIFDNFFTFTFKFCALSQSGQHGIMYGSDIDNSYAVTVWKTEDNGASWTVSRVFTGDYAPSTCAVSSDATTSTLLLYNATESSTNVFYSLWDTVKTVFIPIETADLFIDSELFYITDEILKYIQSIDYDETQPIERVFTGQEIISYQTANNFNVTSKNTVKIKIDFVGNLPFAQLKKLQNLASICLGAGCQLKYTDYFFKDAKQSTPVDYLVYWTNAGDFVQNFLTGHGCTMLLEGETL